VLYILLTVFERFKKLNTSVKFFKEARMLEIFNVSETEINTTMIYSTQTW